MTVTLYYSMTTCTHSWDPDTPEMVGLLRKDNALILDPSYPELVCGGEAILVANTFIWHEPIQILFGHDLHARFCPCKYQGGYGEILTQNFSRDIPITCGMDVTDSPLIFLYQCNFWFSWKNKFKKNVVVQISNLFTIYTLGL